MSEETTKMTRESDVPAPIAAPRAQGRGRVQAEPAKKDAVLEGELISSKPKWMREHPDAKSVRVMFDDVEEAVGGNIFVSINGEAFLIKTGIEVDVPDFLLDHLDNSVTGEPIVDQRTRRVAGYRNVTRFPYRVMRG